MSIDIEKNRAGIFDLYNDLLDDKTTTNWVLYGYEGQSNILKAIGSGEDGPDELVDDLNSSKIMYAIVRVADPKTSRTKIVLINWQGEGAPNVRKGVCSRHLQDVKKLFKGVHITLSARTEEDVETGIILDAVAKATATEYNFNDRSEMPEKTTPVGTNYKRTNPVSEIDANRRNKFWEEQEVEEKVRKEFEMKKREEEFKKLEIQRRERELFEAKKREELTKERNARIFSEKKAEIEADKRCAAKDDGKWSNDVSLQQSEEIERARRADHMRMERKKEAESLIGHKTLATRSIFENQTVSHQDIKEVRPRPAKVLKEFNPVNESENMPDLLSNISEPRRAVGTRWPPSNPEENVQHTAPVPGRITDWKSIEVENTPVSSIPTNNLSQSQSYSKQEMQPQNVEPSRQEEDSRILSQRTEMATRASETTITSCHTHTETHTSSSPYSSPLTSTGISNCVSSSNKISVANEDKSHHITQSESSRHISTEVHSKEEHYGHEKVESGYQNGIVSNVQVYGDQGQDFNQSANRADMTSPNGEEPNSEEIEGEGMMYEVDGVEYQILPEHGLCARALYDYQAADETEITFDPGEILTNISQIDVGWWQGVSPAGVFGLFPANYVELINGK